MSLLRLFGLGKGDETEPIRAAAPAGPVSDTVRRIAAELSHFEPERAQFIASFAFTLARVAHVNFDVSERETRTIEQLVREAEDLTEDEARLVVEIAKSQSELFGATENYLVTREFYESSSKEQRLALLECLFAVCAADHTITPDEEREIRKIADELRLTHRDYIGARIGFREHLSVFKRNPGGNP